MRISRSAELLDDLRGNGPDPPPLSTMRYGTAWNSYGYGEPPTVF